SFLLRHAHVQDDHVVRRLPDPLERRHAVLGAVHLVAASGQFADDQLAQVPLVIGHQHADLPAHSGSTTRNTLPFPTTELTSMRPPWSFTKPWAMARPSPVPCPGGLVVKNGSKIRPRFSAGMPGPS